MPEGTPKASKRLHLVLDYFRYENRLPLTDFLYKTCKVGNHLTIALQLLKKKTFYRLIGGKTRQKVKLFGG